MIIRMDPVCAQSQKDEIEQEETYPVLNIVTIFLLVLLLIFLSY